MKKVKIRVTVNETRSWNFVEILEVDDDATIEKIHDLASDRLYEWVEEHPPIRSEYSDIDYYMIDAIPTIEELVDI